MLTVIAGGVVGLAYPAGAAPTSRCDVARTAMLGAAGDRYAARERYGEAARSYLAATAVSHECRRSADIVVSARFMARAGLALAQAGDYARALDVMHVMRTNLSALGPTDRQTSSDARSLLDLAGDIINTINLGARLSM